MLLCCRSQFKDRTRTMGAGSKVSARLGRFRLGQSEVKWWIVAVAVVLQITKIARRGHSCHCLNLCEYYCHCLNLCKYTTTSRADLLSMHRSSICKFCHFLTASAVCILPYWSIKFIDNTTIAVNFNKVKMSNLIYSEPDRDPGGPWSAQGIPNAHRWRASDFTELS